MIRDGAVAITRGIVAETGAFAALAAKYPGARILGDGTQLLLPGLVDAHSHGRGMSPIQKGVNNDFLENALFDWAYMPVLPPELTAALCAWRHLRSGATLLHHNGFDDDGPEGVRRAHAAIKTYRATGIRLAFSPGVRDESKLVMGGEDFIASLPDELREAARSFVFFDKAAFADEYFRLFDELYDTYNDADLRILLAPSWAHGASEAFLRRVRETAAARGGVMIHMHLLQSPVQKAYGLRRHNKPTVMWLDDLGLVDENVAYGHAIHVTEPEIALMGRRRVSVTSHPSCNFHMRNGITPVMPLRAAGVNVAMGLDDKTINDDEDAVMEVRMMHKVHRLHSFELTTPAMSAYDALEIATVNGARAAGFAREVGALLPGMKGRRDPRRSRPGSARPMDRSALRHRRGVCRARDGRRCRDCRRRPRCRREPPAADDRCRGALPRGERFLRQGPDSRAAGSRRSPRPRQTLCPSLVRQLAPGHGRPALLPRQQPGLGCDRRALLPAFHPRSPSSRMARSVGVSGSGASQSSTRRRADVNR